MDTLDVLRKNLDYFPDLINLKTDEEGWAPLSIAVSRGNQLLSSYLIQEGADITTKLHNG